MVLIVRHKDEGTLAGVEVPLGVVGLDQVTVLVHLERHHSSDVSARCIGLGLEVGRQGDDGHVGKVIDTVSP